MNELESRLLSLYDEIGLGSCGICLECRKMNPGIYPRAVGCWFVGNEFFEQKKRVLFIGKTARGVPGANLEENQNDKGFLNEFRYSRKNLWDKPWPYWSYTSEICRRPFGGAGMEAAAFTNMVKCNGSDTVDRTTDDMKECCIRKLKAAKREIEVIAPTHIVLYTGRDYDGWLDGLFDSLTITRDGQTDIGRKKMVWAEFDALSAGRMIKVLRIGHPERMKKDDYVSAVVDWIKRN